MSVQGCCTWSSVAGGEPATPLMRKCDSSVDSLRCAKARGVKVYMSSLRGGEKWEEAANDFTRVWPTSACELGDFVHNDELSSDDG